jgi:hypothetical protein
MTNQRHPSRRVERVAICAAAFGLIASSLMVGCSSEAEPEPEPVASRAPVVAPPPPPPSAPTVTPISELMVQFDIDSRVQLAEANAPDTDEQRIAVLLFFDSFARGDVSRLSALLSAPDRRELEAMADSDEFSSVTENIFAIDVHSGMSPLGDDVVLGVFMVGEDFQPTLWSYEVTGDPANGGATFDAEPTPPNVISRLHGDNWIQVWYSILGDELARANELDEDIEIPTQDFTDEEDSTTGTPSNPGGPGGGGGGAPGKRKRPTGPKVDPNPGFGPGSN